MFVLLVIAFIVLCLIFVLLSRTESLKHERMVEIMRKKKTTKLEKEILRLHDDIVIDYHKFMLELVYVSQPRTQELVIVFDMGGRRTLLNYYMKIKYLHTPKNHTSKKATADDVLYTEYLRKIYGCVYSLACVHLQENENIKTHTIKSEHVNLSSRLIIGSELIDLLEVLAHTHIMSVNQCYLNGIFIPERTDMIDNIRGLQHLLRECDCNYRDGIDMKVDEQALKIRLKDALKSVPQELFQRSFKNAKKMDIL